MKKETKLRIYAVWRLVAPFVIIIALLLAIFLSAYYFRIHTEIYGLFCRTQLWVEQLNQYEAIKIVTSYTGKLDSDLSLFLLWAEVTLFILLCLFFAARKWFVWYCLRSHEILAYKADQVLVLQRNIRRTSENDSGLLADMNKKFPEFELGAGDDSHNLLNLADNTFCHFSFLDGKFWEVSFEKRNTEVWNEDRKNKELLFKIECISDFYKKLKGQTENEDLKRVFDGLQNVYSQENLIKAIEYVNKKRYDLGMAFIGDKVGLLDYEQTPKNMVLYVYKTDHFTWNVCKYLYERYKDKFVEVFQLLEKYSGHKKEHSLLMKSLFLLFSSMGVDAIVHGTDGDGIRHFLLTLRSGHLQKDGSSRVHISVDESFSFTDIEGNIPDCNKWLKRGVAEEIGYPGIDKEKMKMDVTFYDFAITYALGEVGLCADVEVESIDKLFLCPAQDKYLESKAMFCIPFPYRWYNLYKFWMWSNPNPDYICRIIKKSCKDERLEMKWVSFAPLVYARFFIRQFASNKIYGNVRRAKTLWLHVINLVVLIALLFTNNIISFLSWHAWGYVALAGIIVIAVLMIWNRKKRRKTLFGSSIKPLVPQWTGDVRVLQNTVAGHPYEGRNIYLRGRVNNLSEGLKKYVVKGEPKCAVRTRSGQLEEVPMVFFNIASQKYDEEKGRIHFPLFHIDENHIYYYQLYKLNSTEDSEERAEFQTLSFIFPEEEVSMCNTNEDKDLLCNLHYYLNLPQKAFARDTKEEAAEGKDGLYNLDNKALEMTDLFHFNGDFYFISKVAKEPKLDKLPSSLWKEKEIRNRKPVSCQDMEKKGIDKGALKGYAVTTNTGNYLFALYRFKLATDAGELLKKITRSWAPTSGKLTELEVLALQFLLIRNEPVVYIGK